MQVVLQRVTHASVAVEDSIVGEIQQGYLLLVGIGSEDNTQVMQRAAEDILKLRLMSDGNGKMGVSIMDSTREILAVSQFTLYADFSKGNRPSFHRAAPPVIAKVLWNTFVAELEKGLGRKIAQGIFGADMKVALCNDGPVTVHLTYT